MFTIGQMARAGNCKVQTIRYYEEIELLPKPTRTSGNQRQYSQSLLDRIRFIRHSRELGFSLDQIRKILSLNDDPGNSCEDLDKIAREHLATVESKIERLQSLQKELKRMVSECSCGKVSDCKVIEVLSNHDLCISGHS